MAKKKGPAKKSGYRYGAEVYAKRFGASLRTIRRWRADGRPLDDLPKMREFIAGNRRARSVQMWKTVTTAKRAEIGLQRDEAEKPGLEAEIIRLRQASLQAFEDYQTARRLEAPAQEIRNRLAEWSAVTEQLRKIEKDWPSIQRESDKVLDAGETAFVFQTTLNSFARALHLLPHRFASRLVGLTATEVYECAEAEITRVLRILNSPEVLDLVAIEKEWQARQSGVPVTITPEEETRRVDAIRAALDAADKSDAPGKGRRKTKAKKPELYGPGDYRYGAQQDSGES